MCRLEYLTGRSGGQGDDEGRAKGMLFGRLNNEGLPHWGTWTQGFVAEIERALKDELLPRA